MSDVKEITISLSNIRKVKRAKIGDTVFTVRKLGAGEELELSANMRRAGVLIDSFNKMRKKMLEQSEEEKANTKELTKLAKKMDKFTEELHEIQLFQYESYLKIFDDGTKDQAKTKELLSSLSIDERDELLKQIWAEGAE